MREIKYKVWDTEKKKLLDHNELLDNAKVSATVRGRECKVRYKNSEICMSTGLKDKDGKEIYEGDIVDNVVFNGGSCYDLPQKIYFEDGCFCVGMGYIVDVKSMEVIGNVYENDYMLDKLSK